MIRYAWFTLRPISWMQWYKTLSQVTAHARRTYGYIPGRLR